MIGNGDAARSRQRHSVCAAPAIFCVVAITYGLTSQLLSARLAHCNLWFGFVPPAFVCGKCESLATYRDDSTVLTCRTVT